MTCDVEILSVGNELLLGNTVNTNASWIASHVTSLGGKVARITTVADNLQEISRAIREAITRKPAFIITTGGIGPTFDDMTLRGVARALGLPLALNKTAVMMIREHYARRYPKRRVRLTKPRVKMACLPSGAKAIPNPVGTAPGVMMFTREVEIICLPGVPREAKAMFRNTISKSISAKARGMIFVEKWVKVRGIMESSLAPVIDQVMRRWRRVYIKSHPRGAEGESRPFIELHFSAFSSHLPEAERTLLDAIGDFADNLRDLKARGSRVRREPNRQRTRAI